MFYSSIDKYLIKMKCCLGERYCTILLECCITFTANIIQVNFHGAFEEKAALCTPC